MVPQTATGIHQQEKSKNMNCTADTTLFTVRADEKVDTELSSTGGIAMSIAPVCTIS